MRFAKFGMFLVSIAIVALAAANVTSAQATPTPVPISKPISSYSFTPTRSGGGVSPDATYSCTLNVQNPHNSSHVGGTINVVATISCGIAVTRMSLQVTFYKVVCDPRCGTVPYGTTGSSVTYSNRTIQANSAAACSSGSYFGEAYGSIVAPPGFSPPTGTVEGPGATVAISC
jgi:hypothetical protein